MAYNLNPDDIMKTLRNHAPGHALAQMNEKDIASNCEAAAGALLTDKQVRTPSR